MLPRFILLGWLLTVLVHGEVPVKIPIQIGQRTLQVKIANSPGLRRQGLQNKKTLKPDAGMLFIFPEAKKLSFWMKNTSIPLSIAFLDKKGIIRQIETLKPYNRTTVRSVQKCLYALEVNLGWFKDNQIGLGSRMVLPSGFRPETKK